MANKYCGDGGCFSFSAKQRPYDEIGAAFIGSNVKPPKIGETVTVIDYTVPLVPVTASVTLTKANYIDTLIRWVRYQQITCFNNQKGVYGVFLPKLEVSGTRAVWEPTYSEIGREINRTIDFFKNTTSYKIPTGVFNQEFFNQFLDETSPVSTIDFWDDGGEVLPFGTDKGEVTTRIRKAGSPLAGAGNRIMYMVEAMHEALSVPIHHLTANQSAFTAEISKATEFTFGTPTVTALVPVACSAKCSAYTIAPTVAFTISTPILEAAFASCGSYALYLCDANDEQGALGALASSISINPNTGMITAPAGLAVGTYTFIAEAKNSCCVSGRTCIKITVA